MDRSANCLDPNAVTAVGTFSSFSLRRRAVTIISSAAADAADLFADAGDCPSAGNETGDNASAVARDKCNRLACRLAPGLPEFILMVSPVFNTIPSLDFLRSFALEPQWLASAKRVGLASNVMQPCRIVGVL
jgi:hypothetical protein